MENIIAIRLAYTAYFKNMENFTDEDLLTIHYKLQEVLNVDGDIYIFELELIPIDIFSDIPFTNLHHQVLTLIQILHSYI